MLAESLRHTLGDLGGKDDRTIYAYDDGSDGYYELTVLREEGDHVVLVLGQYLHNLPRGADE